MVAAPRDGAKICHASLESGFPTVSAKAENELQYLTLSAVVPLLASLGAAFCVYQIFRRSARERALELPDERLQLAIQERKKAEEALRQSEEQFRSFVDHFPAAIFFKDRDGRYLRTNKVFENWYRVEEQDFVGKTTADYFAENEVRVYAEHDRIVLEKQKVVEEEHLVNYPDGKQRSTLIIKFPLLDGAGHSIGVGAINLDNTERKRSEIALRATKEEAQMANRAKSEFLANMSHELRTPLNAIIPFSEMLANEMFGPLGAPKYREYAAAIHRAGGHLLQVLSDILDISKIEAGETSVKNSDLDIRKAVEDCLTMVKLQAKAAHVQIQFIELDRHSSLRADERHVKQIVLNLLSNAVKFTPTGGQVTVTTRLDITGRWEISVTDTGIGIAVEDFPKIMEPFGQVADSHRRGHNGTGLGLPICNSLMALHGGSLNIESQLGRGTTVTVSFPAERTIRCAPPRSRAM